MVWYVTIAGWCAKHHNQGLRLRGDSLAPFCPQVWSLKDVASPATVVCDAESFPGPASGAPVDKLREYVEKRATAAATGGDEAGAEAEGKRLLWSVAGLALQFKVRFFSAPDGVLFLCRIKVC